MKFGPVTKLDKRNNTTLKKFDNDVISTNCDQSLTQLSQYCFE